MRGDEKRRDATKRRMLTAAGRGFRLGGYAGVGVDGLAKEAGLTSGAFYSHFSSKARAFREVLVDGLAALRGAIEKIQRKHGESWQGPFARFYFRDLLQLGLEEACALPTFSGDAARADDQTREAYEQELRAVAAKLADGDPHGEEDARRARAWVLLALCAGGASMARAVKDPDLAREIAQAVEDAAHNLG